MSYEMVIGLEVSDEESYRAYRQGMFPILVSHGGGFRYDFTIGEVLKAEVGHDINRLFAIYFKDQAASEAFFQNQSYLSVRREYFEPAVKNIVIIASYQR